MDVDMIANMFNDIEKNLAELSSNIYNNLIIPFNQNLDNNPQIKAFLESVSEERIEF